MLFHKIYLTSILIRKFYFSHFQYFVFFYSNFLLINFFFIRSLVMTINNSLLNEKYNNVIKSICEMMSAKKSVRPTCEQLLNNKSLWALSMSDIQNDLMFKKFKNLSISESLTKNNFCDYFIKMKSMHI